MIRLQLNAADVFGEHWLWHWLDAANALHCWPVWRMLCWLSCLDLSCKLRLFDPVAPLTTSRYIGDNIALFAITLYWRFGIVVSTLVSINEVNLRRARLVLGWATVSRVQLLVPENLAQYITSHPGQLSLAVPPWVGLMSISQRAVMPCGWEVKAGMVRMSGWLVKLCDPLAITGHIWAL